MKKIALIATIITIFLSLLITRCAAPQLPFYVWPAFHNDEQRTGQTIAQGPYWLNRWWTYDTGYPVTSSPVVGNDGTIYFGSTDTYPTSTPKLYALNIDGTLKWSCLLTSYGKVSTAPALSPDGTTVYVATHENVGAIRDDFFAIKTLTGSIKWSWAPPAGQYFGTSNPVAVDYAGTTEVYIVSDAATGDPTHRILYQIPDLGGTYGTIKQWNDPSHPMDYPTSMGEASPSPAVAADGTIYVGVLGGLAAIDPGTFTSRAYITLSAPDNFFSPSVREDAGTNIIYVGSTNYELYAVEDTAGSLTERWAYTALGEEITTCPAIKDLNGDGYPEVVFASTSHLYAVTDDGHHPNTPPSDLTGWPFSFNGFAIVSSPAIDNGNTVYVCATTWTYGMIYAIAYDYGRGMWSTVDSYQTGGPILSSPAISTAILPQGYVGGMGWLFVGVGAPPPAGGSDYNLYAFAGAIPRLPSKHELRVDCVMLEGRDVYPGWSVKAVISNAGNQTEVANVTAYLDNTTVGVAQPSIAPGMNATLNWLIPSNLTLYVNYTLRVEVSQVPGETILGDNVYICSNILIKMTGDVNGDFKVGLPDLVLLAQAYGSKPGDSNWNPNADINGHGIVDLSDLVTLATHYGQSYP